MDHRFSGILVYPPACPRNALRLCHDLIASFLLKAFDNLIGKQGKVFTVDANLLALALIARQTSKGNLPQAKLLMIAANLGFCILVYFSVMHPIFKIRP